MARRKFRSNQRHEPTTERSFQEYVFNLPAPVTSRTELLRLVRGGEDTYLELAGTGLRLERCRQYFLFTRKEDSRLDNITIYATPSDWTWPQVDIVAQSARQKLIADGWTPGRFVYHTPELQALHAGERDGYGQYWLKDDVLFQIDPRPTETQPVGSDPHAGQFTLYYRIYPLRWADHPHLEFPGHARPTPAAETKPAPAKAPRR